MLLPRRALGAALSITTRKRYARLKRAQINSVNLIDIR
jgi:hypothetical protein